MPRSRPVDYPPVHPPTAQAYQGLAPPSNVFAEASRFSWQNSSTDLVSPSHVAEQELEAGISGKDQERRTSTVPPLPVLPNHLGGTGQENNGYQEVTQEKADESLRTDIQVHSPARTEVAQQYYQQIPQQQAHPFQPDIPTHLQQRLQHQTDLHRQPSGPPLSYEASQAQIASRQPSDPPSKMQEQPIYPGHYNGSDQPMTAHALPLHTSYQPAPIPHVESSDQKPKGQNQSAQIPQQVPSVQLHRPNDQVPIISLQPRPTAVYIGPDIHPLSPTTPTMTSPTHMARSQTLPPSDQNPDQFAFPQVAPFNPPNPRRTGGTWNTSLFSCSNPSICLASLTCPCIIYGRTQYRLTQKSANKDPTNMLGYSMINGSCIAWSILCGVNVLLTTIQHTRIRKKYEMHEGSGNVPGDCLKSLCCCCCMIALDEKEVKMREEGRMTEGTVDKAYTSPGTMMYAPPPQ